MPAIDRQDEAVARLYASAMFDVAEAAGRGDALLDELRDLVSYMDTDREFGRFLASLRIDAASRKKVLEKLFRGKYSDLFVDSLQVLNERERLALLSKIADAYYHIHEDARGRVEVHVRTPVPLTEPLRQRVRELAGKYTGKQADLVERTDESLIGGLVLQIGDEKFDASVKRRLDILHETLLERASKELHSGKTYYEGAAT
jgi:F-type H+-transporting ATPase subunit delta